MTFAKIVLVFVMAGPPAGALAWAGINVVHGLATGGASASDIASLLFVATFMACVSYVAGGFQALLVGLATAIHWAITKRLQYAWSALYAVLVFGLASPLLSFPATWASEPFALKPRALATSIRALLGEPDKLMVWGAVHVLAAVAAVYLCRELLAEDTEE